MQHTDKQAMNETSEIVYLIDQGSGWEHDEDVLWVIDAGNEAEWENQVPYILN